MKWFSWLSSLAVFNPWDPCAERRKPPRVAVAMVSVHRQKALTKTVGLLAILHSVSPTKPRGTAGSVEGATWIL